MDNYFNQRQGVAMQSARNDQIDLAVSLNALLEDATRKKIKTILERVRDVYDAPNQSWVWFVPYYLLGLRSRTGDINKAIDAFDNTQKPAIEIINQLFSIGNWKETSVNTLLMREFIVELNKGKNKLPPHELQLINLLLTMAQKIKVQLQLKELETVRCERNDELAEIVKKGAAKKAKENLEQLKTKFELKPKTSPQRLSIAESGFAKNLERIVQRQAASLMTNVKMNAQPGEVPVIEDYKPVTVDKEKKSIQKELTEADLALFKKQAAPKQQAILSELAKRMSVTQM